MIYLKALFATISFLITNTALAGACAQNNGNFQTNGGTDPCASYELNKTGATRNYTSTVTHTATAAICFIQASNPTGESTRGCQLSNTVSSGSDVAGEVILKDKSETLIGALSKSGTNNSDLLKKFAANATTDLAKSATKNEKSDENDQSAAMKIAAENALKAFGALNAAEQAKDQAKEAEHNKELLYQAEQDKKLKSQELENTTLASNSQSGSALNDNSEIVSVDDIKQSAATAQMMPLHQEWFKATGGKSLNELIDRIHKGQEPFAAAYEMTKDAMGENGATFAQMSKIAKELVDREMPRSKFSDKNYESSLAGFSSTNQKTAKVSEESDLFSGLLSKLGLGKDEKEKLEKEKALAALNNSRKIASLEEGIHPASRSIFEIVDNRYHLLSGSFLTGTDIGIKPSSIPKNIYLKK